MEKINIRSPYYVRNLVTSKDYVKCEVFIYSGDSVTDRGAATYTLTQRTPENKNYAFEISELIKDYLDVEFNGSYNSYMTWVDYRFTQGTDAGGDDTPTSYTLTEAYDGYGYFQEGSQSSINQYNENFGMFSNNVIYHLASESLVLPIRSDDVFSIVSKLNGVTKNTYNYIEELDSNDRVQYPSWDTTTTPIDELTIDGDSYEVVLIEECKYEPVKVTFVNKYGALQDLWFFKRNSKDIQTKSTEYQANLVNSGLWSNTSHQKTITDNNGQESIALNSGYYPEEYNEVFKQLLLSEKVWLKVDNTTRPVNISSKSMSFKTQLDDKLIEYAIKFNFSNDIINNIR